MAKIHEEVIIIKLSRLIKDSDVDSVQDVNSDTLNTIESVVQELVGESVIVEIERA